jgi:hypothetical protein
LANILRRIRRIPGVIKAVRLAPQRTDESPEV